MDFDFSLDKEWEVLVIVSLYLLSWYSIASAQQNLFLWVHLESRVELTRNARSCTGLCLCANSI